MEGIKGIEAVFEKSATDEATLAVVIADGNEGETSEDITEHACA